MRYIIVGAGAVGGAIGGRLAEAGHQVVLVARGAHHDALHRNGLTLTTPEGTRNHKLPVIDGPEALRLRRDDVLLLTVKTQDSAAALDAWAARPVEGGGWANELLPLICAQNGVESERLALRRFRQVYAMSVRLPATYVEPGVVSAPGTPYTGLLHLGRYPGGTDETAHRVGEDLEAARLLAPVVPDVMRWKYAKLLQNLANSIDAVSGVLVSDEARELYERAFTEGQNVLDAAGIKTVDETELAAVRDSIQFDFVDGSQRSGGSSWQSLYRGTGSIEADYLNGEIALLGRLHSIPTPVNEALQRIAGTFARERRLAGSLSAAELVRLVDTTG